MKRLPLALLAVILSAPAGGQVLKIATVAPEASEWMQGMRAGAGEIRERTGGRVQIKYYGGGIQGSDATVLRKIRIGSLHGGAFTPSAIADEYGDINLYALPLVFDSADEASYVRQRMDERIIAGLEEAGFVSFGFAATGFAIIMSAEPVSGVADLQGKKVWVPQGDGVSYASMKALNLSPQTLPLTDVLVGLQTELIDIVPVSPIGALVMQWHTRVKYLTDMPLVYTFGFMVVDKRAFNRIEPEDRAIVHEVMTQLYADFDKKNVIDDVEAKQALINAGVKRVVPDADEMLQIRETLADSNRSLAEQGEVSLDLYEEMLRYIAEYRSEHQSAAVR